MRISYFLAFVTLCIGTVSRSEVLVVQPDGSGDFPTIQDAVDASTDGDVIELGSGTFRGTGNRDINYHGKPITVRSQTGAPGDCIIDCEGSSSARHRGFHFGVGNPGASLEGITITNGFSEVGGGISCGSQSVARLADCRIIGNFATDKGGGLDLFHSEVTMENCVVSNNTASGEEGQGVGGGILCSGSLVARGCLISGNVSHSGGGLWSFDCEVQVIDSEVQDNLADYNAGISCNTGTVDVLRTTFQRNVASLENAGMWLHNLDGASVVGSIFANNVCDTGSTGGLAVARAGDATIESCLFYANQGSAVSSNGQSHLDIANCTIAKNFGVTGSAILVRQGASIRLSQSIVFGNDGIESIFCEDGSIVLECCDVFSNSAGDWIGCISDQRDVNGNISLDPLFCDVDEFDFSLQDGSPCAPSTPPNPECGRVGALPVRCPGDPTPTLETSWGTVKDMFFRQ